MMVLFEDGTMGRLRWDKKVVGIVFYTQVCSFGLGGGRYCVLDLQDSPAELTKDQLHQLGKECPDMLDWHSVDIDRINATLQMLKEDGYTVELIDKSKAYRASYVITEGIVGPVKVVERLFDFVSRKAIPASEKVALRACRYGY